MSRSNGKIGILMGTIVMALGFYVICRVKRKQDILLEEDEIL